MGESTAIAAAKPSDVCHAHAPKRAAKTAHRTTSTTAVVPIGPLKPASRKSPAVSEGSHTAATASELLTIFFEPAESSTRGETLSEIDAPPRSTLPKTGSLSCR